VHPIKLIAKLTPKTTNYGATGGGTSLDSVDWTHAAYSLSGLNNEAYHWALFRFAGHDEKEPSIIRALTRAITIFITTKRFKIKVGNFDGLVRTALMEFIQPVCGLCGGSGWVSDIHGPGECKPCNGKGRKPVSTRERCKIIGISHKSYTNSHDEVTKEVMIIISRWEQQIFKNINDKMGEVA
jgi:hypothetical protein